MPAPLEGLRIVEMPAIGPVPFCGMLLADLGAEVLRVDRPHPIDQGLPVDTRFSVSGRGKRSLVLDLKQPGDIRQLLAILDKADVVLEGFRPGTMERLGLGPDTLLQRNPRLVYGRMTGWGQEGPLAQAAGHDINYLALTGALHAIGRAEQAPVPPLNLVADFGGGAMFLALGVLAALQERGKSGSGQVVDAAMLDGVSSLLSVFHGLLAGEQWRDERGVNVLDSGAPWYDSYECKDGEFVAIGAIETKFFVELMTRLGLDAASYPNHKDRTCWPRLRAELTQCFRQRSRGEWCELLEGSDACFAPVLSLREAVQHSHNRARGAFIDQEGVQQPVPAPRFSRTPGRIQRPPPKPDEGGKQLLQEWGVQLPS